MLHLSIYPSLMQEEWQKVRGSARTWVLDATDIFPSNNVLWQTSFQTEREINSLNFNFRTHPHGPCCTRRDDVFFFPDDGVGHVPRSQRQQEGGWAKRRRKHKLGTIHPHSEQDNKSSLLSRNCPSAKTCGLRRKLPCKDKVDNSGEVQRDLSLTF